MVAEGNLDPKHSQFEYPYVGGNYIMEASPRVESPSPDKVSSAADAMLRLSGSRPTLTQMYMVQTSPNIAQAKVKAALPHESLDNLMEHGELSSIQGQHKPDLSLVANRHRISRKQREFTPDTKKDDQYWVKRKKNNEAAKRSREKRRMNDVVLGQKIMEVSTENSELRRELEEIKREFGIPIDRPFKSDQPYKHDNSNNTSLSMASPRSISSDSNSSYSVVQQIVPPNVELTKLLAPAVAQQLTSLPQHLPVSNTGMPPMGITKPMPLLIPVTASQSVSLLTSGHANFTTNGAAITTTLPLESMPTNIQIKQENLDESHNDYPGSTTGTAQDSFIGSDTQANEAAAFHSCLRAPDICDPISPESCSSSPHSLTIAFSNASSSDNSDNERNIAPLNLSKRQGEEIKALEIVPYEDRVPRSRERKGIPHKLRHKEQFLRDDMSESDNSGREDSTEMMDMDGVYAQDNMSQQYQYDQWTSNLTDNTTSGEDNPNSAEYGTRYVERRNRNNLAARKCRENRKMLTHIRVAKSNILERENNTLKEELRNLADEVKNLKEWIGKKNEAKAKGEKFSLPPEDNIQGKMSATSDTN